MLDFSTGAALDFFVGNETIATVYGKLPFPGVPDVSPAHGPRYFCLFEEIRNAASAGKLHHFEITYDGSVDRVIFSIDGSEVRRYSNVPFKLGACTLALGLMTEKRYRSRERKRLMSWARRGREMGKDSYHEADRPSENTK